jgi:hypothetical protein
VVSRSKDINTGVKQLTSCGRGYAQTTGGILTIGYNHVHPVLLPQAGQKFNYRPPARQTNDVTYRQY